MNLPPKAINALIDIKRELVARIATSEEIEKDAEPQGFRREVERKVRPKEDGLSARHMRHARNRNVHFQNMCRRREMGWGV